jgi:cytoskeletal protein RodZ
MENRDLALDESFAENEPLTLPHFDEEATVQSARPVVPLDEVRRASRSRQKLLLGAALCLAAVVGAIAASLIFSDRPQPSEESATSTIPHSSEEASNGFITPSGEASGATVDPNETVAIDTAAATPDRSDETLEVQASPRVSRQQPVRNSRVSKPVEKVASRPEPEPEDLEADERAARREERREARRLRRERRAGDGLTRIREIFEGSPRP